MRVITFLFVAFTLFIGLAAAQSPKQSATKVDTAQPAPQVAAQVMAVAELSRDAAVILRAVPNSQLLATERRQPTPAPAPASVVRCAADASVTFFDARITTPITVCSPLAAVDLLDNPLFFRDAKPARSKLTDRSILQSLAGLKNSTLALLPYVCATGNGPWSARIISERRCMGSCRPYNHLFVVGVPNSVEFGWFGSLNQHPAGFEFVGALTRTDHQSLGQCNGGPGGGN